VWHAVGMANSITEWALRSSWCGRPIGHAQGEGVLVSALGVLAMHYGLNRKSASCSGRKGISGTDCVREDPSHGP
jgi:hypothetical protein